MALALLDEDDEIVEINSGAHQNDRENDNALPKSSFRRAIISPRPGDEETIGFRRPRSAPIPGEGDRVPSPLEIWREEMLPTSSSPTPVLSSTFESGNNKESRAELRTRQGQYRNSSFVRSIPPLDTSIVATDRQNSNSIDNVLLNSPGTTLRKTSMARMSPLIRGRKQGNAMITLSMFPRDEELGTACIDSRGEGERGGLVTCSNDELLVDVGEDIESMVISVIATPKNTKRSVTRTIRLHASPERRFEEDRKTSDRDPADEGNRESSSDRKEKESAKEPWSERRRTRPESPPRETKRDERASMATPPSTLRKDLGKHFNSVALQERCVPIPTTPPSPSFDKARTPCMFFMRGFCEFGEKCRYSHDIVTSGGAVMMNPLAAVYTPPSPYQQHIPVAYYGPPHPSSPPVPGYHVASPSQHTSRRSSSSTRRRTDIVPPPSSSSHPRYHRQQRTRRGMRTHPSSSVTAAASLSSSASPSPPLPSSPLPMTNIAGNVWELSQEQHGCRKLQKLLRSQPATYLPLFVEELKPHLASLMVNPFGNYLFQRILDTLDPTDRALHEVIDAVAPHLTKASKHVNGTRSAQKVIEHCMDKEQRLSLARNVARDIVVLGVHSQATHVVMRCLEVFPVEARSVVIDGVIEHLNKIVRNAHGCRIAQICFDKGTVNEQSRIVQAVAKRALDLARDVRGNYAVQHVLKYGKPNDVRAVVAAFKGHFAVLSMQKFSSNVVEVCLKKCGGDQRRMIVRELSVKVLPLLKDQYANYVVQRALMVSDNVSRRSLIDAIRPRVKELLITSSGRRVLGRLRAIWPESGLPVSSLAAH